MRKLLASVLFPLALGLAQTDAGSLKAILEPAILPSDAVTYEIKQYLVKRVPPLPGVSSAAEWTAEAKRLRERVLREVIYHGWPREWVEATPKFEDLGAVPSGPGYRMRKLRYQVVPGFYATAILYEPETVSGRAPAVLNVNGHVGAEGKAVEYKQKRCINQARMGMVALNLEWIGQGELSQKGNAHTFIGHLDLTGAAGVGLFYLSMRQGLDYLAARPDVDPARLAVTGLSGGGWQTIVLSALDERVLVSIPVAGFASYASSLANGDIGDNEQSATDLIGIADYAHLVAMRAPRPTLLINNAEDNCCYRGPMVRVGIFDPIRPFFGLFGASGKLAYHENTDPSTHNYQLDNRQQAYRFLARHFGLPVPDREIPVDAEIKSFAELAVGLPPGALTMADLASKLAGRIERRPMGALETERSALRQVLRYQPVKIARPWLVANTKSRGLETLSYRLEFDNGISATAVWLKAIAAPRNAPATIVLRDEGKRTAAPEISDRVNRGEQVLGVDLLFTGDMVPNKPAAWLYSTGMASLRDRPLGVRAAQLIGTARWLASISGQSKIRLEATGLRSQVVAQIAAALDPGLFSTLAVHKGIRSLQYLLDQPVEMTTAPELFCLDLYKEFDLDRLDRMSGEVQKTPF
jgi:dienelactone hydrolase